MAPAIDTTRDESVVTEVTEDITPPEIEPTPVPEDRPMIPPVPAAVEVVETETTLETVPVEPPKGSKIKFLAVLNYKYPFPNIVDMNHPCVSIDTRHWNHA